MTFVYILLFCFSALILLAIIQLFVGDRMRKVIKIAAVIIGVLALVIHSFADANGEYAKIGNETANVVVPLIQDFGATSIGKMIVNTMYYVQNHTWALYLVVGILMALFYAFKMPSDKRRTRRL